MLDWEVLEGKERKKIQKSLSNQRLSFEFPFELRRAVAREKEDEKAAMRY